MKELTKYQKERGYVWKCPVCGHISKYYESVCENCMKEDV